MAAIVTDQFRILNANNFVDSVLNTNNSYYTFLGLVNSNGSNNFGRKTNWDTNTPNPTDNFQYSSHYKETALFGKKIKNSDIRRVVRRVNWIVNTPYDMYRHDYSVDKPTPNSNSSRLYDSNYYVINSEFKVYICLDNGSYGESGSTTSKGKRSEDEPTFTDLEPTSAGTSNDGYIWKYLFTISPSDIIKFDSTEYIVLPNNWTTSSDIQVKNVRESANSDLNFNQIRKVYIEKSGLNYSQGTHVLDILGDGSGGRVSVTVNSNGQIIDTDVVSGGSGYTYGVVDLGSIQPGILPENDKAKLVPIIPPSKGHGYDLYTELGADKVLIYNRFDDSNNDFPTDTNFSQVGILKNPQYYSSETIFKENQFSSLHSIMLSGVSDSFNPTIGEKISQVVTGGTAKGYVASYDKKTKVLKYSTDRSLYFKNGSDQTDAGDVSSYSKVLEFSSSIGNNITFETSSLSASIDTFSGIAKTVGNELVDLGVNFTNGLANPEINRKTGDLIYIDNRTLINRDLRQKEDVKIILEF